MKKPLITFKDKAEELPFNKFLAILKTNRTQAKFFSRAQSHQELVAVVASGNTTDDRFYWVWLSGRDDGAFCGGELRYPPDVARTLVKGGWIYQPNIQIILENLEKN